MRMDKGTQLRITRRREGTSPVRQPDGFLLEGEADWLVQGPAGPLRELLESLPHVAEELSENLLLLHFGNEVGVVRVPHLGRLEIRSRKWGPEHFQRMLEELSRISAALPFSVARPAALPFARRVPIGRDVLYHAWVYLRWAVLGARGEENLEEAMRLVLAEPHEVLQRARRKVPPGLACRVDARGLQRLVSGEEPLSKMSGFAAPLVHALDGHVPEAVEESISRRSVDTPENRFVLSLLDQCLWIVERMEEEVLQAGKAWAHPRAVHDNEELRRRLGLLRKAPLWLDVGPMAGVPASSTILQRRRGYRDLFRHFARLRLAARVPLDPQDGERLLESKNIALLYELWCFFKVVEATQDAAGRPDSASRISYGPAEVSLKHGFEISWRNGLRVLYNPLFSRGARGFFRSYSVGLRPDVAIIVPNGPEAGLHLLDAKFRIDQPGFLFEEDDNDFSAEASFKKADLYKMHTYRDALSEARSVWILYPGTEMRFFEAGTGNMANGVSGLPRRIEGVGALALRPERDGDMALKELIRTLVGMSSG